MPQLRPGQLDELLRDHGCRVTPQRSHIYTVLMDGGGHPTAEEVHEQACDAMPNLSLRTVYDTLHLFVELGLVHRLDTGAGVIRYDTNLTLKRPGVRRGSRYWVTGWLAGSFRA